MSLSDNKDPAIPNRGITPEKSSMYRANLPKAMRRWVDELSPTSWHSGRMYQLYRKAGKEMAMLILATREAAMTEVAYGPDHPDADPLLRLRTQGIDIKDPELLGVIPKLKWEALRQIKGDHPAKAKV